MSCSGHSPPLSHTGQSSGWLISRNSTTELLGGLDALGLRVHDHAVLDRRGAAGLQLGDALDLDQAHAAGADGVAELGLVAEHRDLDVAVLGGVDEHRVLRRLHLEAIDREGDRLRLGPRHQASLTRSRARAPRRATRCGFELVAELRDHRADRHRHRVAEHAQAVADDVLLHGRHDLEVHRGGLAGSMRSSICTVQLVPSRQGVHLPQDSCR